MALLRVPPPVVADAAVLSVSSSAMEAKILLYCVVVAAAIDSITAVLTVAAADRAPKWQLNSSMKETGAPTMWLLCGPAVVGGEILWTRAAECAKPKVSLRPVAILNSCLSALWRRRK